MPRYDHIGTPERFSIGDRVQWSEGNFTYTGKINSKRTITGHYFVIPDKGMPAMSKGTPIPEYMLSHDE